MEILYGTKGGREPGDAAKAGKPRTLRFAASFLRELSDYATLRRAKAAGLFKAGHPGCPVPPQLFLSERTGEAITAAALYKAWHACESLPYPGFSPHIGRHSFACLTLLRLLQEEMALTAGTLGAVPRSTLLEHARNLVGVYIRPVLGHASETTTERYLGWIADHVWVAEHRGAWSAYLDGADG
jgi:integrase